MLRSRHLLHPIRSAQSICRRATTCVKNLLFKWQFQHIRRTHRDLCWCNGALEEFTWHPSYGVCINCGTYVNRRPPIREDLATIYSLGPYWKTRQLLRGYPSIEKRGALYRSDGRLQHWLNLIDKYGPTSGRVVEIGCAPGVLLQELRARGYECVGVEINSGVADWMRETTGLDIHAGFFPGVHLQSCDLFLAFDVLEHSPCPDDFFHELSQRLKSNGVAIIQTVVDRYDYRPPFGSRFDVFDDIEHLFLFTDTAIRRLATNAGLETVSLDESLWVGGEICVFRKS